MIGKTISHYKILEKLGEGGMGVVYKAQDTKLKRHVALKFLPPELTRDKEAKDRFIHEARAAAGLDHNNICAVYEIDETKDGQMYIAMACYDGVTLKEKIEKGPLKLDEAIDIAIQVAQGLERAHESNIIHRDIKSANIFITPRDEVKIIDFGLAKLRGTTKITKEGTTLGTVSYMSPEQASGENVDHRSDIWSLGVLLYEMITGQLPFKGEYEQAVIYSIMNEDPVPLHNVNRDIPLQLKKIVSRALTKEPGDRYQTMMEFKEDLEASHGGPKTFKTSSGQRSAHPVKKIHVFAGLGLIAVLIILNIGGIRDWILGRRESPIRTIKLAVLPFANLTGDAEQEYFSAGITEEMIKELGRLHPAGLSVIGRTSVLRYKQGDTPIDKIGRDLGVEYILEGSTQSEADHVRITAKLIRVQDQTQLWGDSYDRKLSGILALQSEVAQRVAEALALKLLPREQIRLTTVRFVNPEAHDAYLKGSYHWKKLTRKDIDIARGYFELALKKDSTYAPIYEGLAFVWAAYQQMGYLPMSEVALKAKAAALKAVALDDYSAEAHFALAGIKSWIDWDWSGAKLNWRRALELNPNYATALAYYASFLAIMGDIDEAISYSKRAVELDPFNAMLHGMYASVLNYDRLRYKDAEATARYALTLQSDLPIAYSNLMRALMGQGKYDELIAMRRKLYLNDAELKAAFDKGLAEGGYKGAQRRIADIYVIRYGKHDVLRAQTVASKYFDAGDYDRAMEWFEKAFENHEGNLPYINRPYYYDTLRSDPRYLNLLRRMNIPEIKRKSKRKKGNK